MSTNFITNTYTNIGITDVPIPSGFTSVTISAVGAGGGGSPQHSSLGGRGGQVVATFPITNQSILSYSIGGGGITNRGGGYTQVLSDGNSINVIAGGGGGGAIFGSGSYGGGDGNGQGGSQGDGQGGSQGDGQGGNTNGNGNGGIGASNGTGANYDSFLQGENGNGSGGGAGGGSAGSTFARGSAGGSSTAGNGGNNGGGSGGGGGGGGGGYGGGGGGSNVGGGGGGSVALLNAQKVANAVYSIFGTSGTAGDGSGGQVTFLFQKTAYVLINTGQTSAYGTTPPTPTYVFKPNPDGTGSTITTETTGSPTFAGMPTATSDAGGAYNVTYSSGLSSTDYYFLPGAAVAYSITQVTAYILIANGQSSAYKTTPPTPTYVFNTNQDGSGSVITPVSTTGSATFAGMPTATSNAGGTYNVKYSGGLSSPNYVFLEGNPRLYSVTQLTAYVIISARQSSVYGTTPPTPTYLFNTNQDGSGSTITTATTGSPTFAGMPTASSSIPDGTYNVTYSSGLSSTNYIFSPGIAVIYLIKAVSPITSQIYTKIGITNVPIPYGALSVTITAVGGGGGGGGYSAGQGYIPGGRGGKVVVNYLLINTQTTLTLNIGRGGIYLGDNTSNAGEITQILSNDNTINVIAGGGTGGTDTNTANRDIGSDDLSLLSINFIDDEGGNSLDVVDSRGEENYSLGRSGGDGSIALFNGEEVTSAVYSLFGTSGAIGFGLDGFVILLFNFPEPPPSCCPLKINGDKPGTISGGSGSGVQGSHQSRVLGMAQILKNTSGRLKGRTIFVNNQLNAYGSYNGAPGGSRAPPRNTF